MIEFLLIPAMAYLSRMCGGAPPKLPLFTDQFIWGLVFAGVAFIALLPTAGHIFSPYPWHIWVLSVISGITACLGKLTGHGRGIGVYEPMKGDPEKVEAVSLWLLPHIPTWAYKCVILALCEAVVWSGIALAISPWLMLGLFLRPVAYLIGWHVWFHAVKHNLLHYVQSRDGANIGNISYLPSFLGRPTAIGEFLTGAFSGCVLAAILSLT